MASIFRRRKPVDIGGLETTIQQATTGVADQVATHLGICDSVNALAAAEQLEEVVRTLRTRLASRDLVAMLQTLRLSEMLIKNCGMRFAQVAASHKPFLQQLEQTADFAERKSKKREPGSATALNKCLELVQAWGEEFLPLRTSHGLEGFVELYHRMRARGFRFPAPQLDETRPPIFTPPATAAGKPATAASSRTATMPPGSSSGSATAAAEEDAAMAAAMAASLASAGLPIPGGIPSRPAPTPSGAGSGAAPASESAGTGLSGNQEVLANAAQMLRDMTLACDSAEAAKADSLMKEIASTVAHGAKGLLVEVEAATMGAGASNLSLLLKLNDQVNNALRLYKTLCKRGPEGARAALAKMGPAPARSHTTSVAVAPAPAPAPAPAVASAPAVAPAPAPAVAPVPATGDGFDDFFSAPAPTPAPVPAPTPAPAVIPASRRSRAAAPTTAGSSKSSGGGLRRPRGSSSGSGAKPAPLAKPRAAGGLGAPRAAGAAADRRRARLGSGSANPAVGGLAPPRAANGSATRSRTASATAPTTESATGIDDLGDLFGAPAVAAPAVAAPAVAAPAVAAPAPDLFGAPAPVPAASTGFDDEFNPRGSTNIPAALAKVDSFDDFNPRAGAPAAVAAADSFDDFDPRAPASAPAPAPAPAPTPTPTADPFAGLSSSSGSKPGTAAAAAPAPSGVSSNPFDMFD